MGGFRLDQEEGAATAGGRKKETEDSSWSPNPHFQAQHRRSKSASDRKINVSRDGVSHRAKKEQNELIASPLSTRTYRTRSPLHDSSAYSNKITSSNQRASLEKDIELLQLRLQQEKSMRLMLERVMGRASSTLSPGHRHFATQTQELIAEIELLEEEVANREQHVLSLYRNIFDNCVSRQPSEQSSGKASPAHMKHTSRKHPSIISSAFCSSKKFPLRPWQALVSTNGSGKRISRSIDASQFCGKSDILFDNTSSHLVKAHEKIQGTEKTSALRTLKDHLHQCPSKLSEEMVRYMAAVYCGLRSAPSSNSEKNLSPLLSRSSTKVALPKRGVGEDQDFSCTSNVEISWISTDRNQFSRASYAISNYRVLVEQLEKVTVSQMEYDAQIAFWINVYNALVMHVSLSIFSIWNSPRFFETVSLVSQVQASYNIGGHVISANAIEQSIFCFRTPRTGRWLETILSTALRKKSGEERQIVSSKFGLSYSQPLACFALCTGAFSDPVLKVYTASNVKEELEAATREFLQANLVVKKSKKVFLPRVLERFAKEASIGSDDLLNWVLENVDKKLHNSIQKCMDGRSKKKPSQVIDWLPYSSRFSEKKKRIERSLLLTHRKNLPSFSFFHCLRFFTSIQRNPNSTSLTIQDSIDDRTIREELRSSGQGFCHRMEGGSVSRLTCSENLETVIYLLEVVRDTLMDYDDNDLQSQNLHLAGEGNNKFPPVLRPYDLPRFDFDDNLRGHLRFDSLVETEVFLGIESGEDNQWIEEYSRGSTGIAFSSSAAEPCLISRRNNVWSEAASSESVEMLLKSLGQDENNLAQTISKDSDACDELGCIIKQMDPSLKHKDSELSKVVDDIQPALQTGEIPGICIGDHQLVEEASQTHEREPSVHGALEDPNSRNIDKPVTETDELKDGKQIVLDENRVEASVDQSLDNRGQEDKFASGSEVGTVIPSVQSTCMSSVLIDDQDSTHLKNDIIDKNVDNLDRGNAGLSPERHIGGRNLIDDTVATVTSLVQEHSALDVQSREDEHAIGSSTANVDEPSDRILKGSSYFHVEECSEGVGVEIPLQTGKSEDIILSEGKLYDTSPIPVVIDSILKEHENEVSNTDTISCTGLESKVISMVQVASDAIEKEDLLESDCRPDKKILSSKSEKSLLSVEDGKGSKDEDKGSHATLVAEPMRVCEKYVVTEHNDDNICDGSVSVAAKQKTSLPSDCSTADCRDDGSPLITKGVDSSSFSAGGEVNELASNLQPDVPISTMSVDCVLLPSGKDIPADTVSDQTVVQVPSLEASFSVIKTSETTTEKGASCETGEQLSCKKVDQSLLMEDTTTVEGESGDQTLCRVSDSTVRKTDGDEAQVISKKVSTDAAGDVSTQLNKTSMNSVLSTSMETSHNADQNHPKDSDSKLVSEELSGHVVHHIDVDPAKTCNASFASTPSSESQTKFRMTGSGSSSADLDNPSCGSPVVFRTSEQSQSKIENEGVRGSKDQSALVSGITTEEANKEQSISQDRKGTDATPGDKSFTFEVPPLLAVSEQEAGKNWKPFSTMQHDKISSAMEGTPSTPGLSVAGPKAAQETSRTNPQVTRRGNVRGGSKGTSERKPRRSGSKSAGKEAAKKGNATKETTPARQSERSDRTSNVSLSSAGTGQLVQSHEMQHHGHIEGVFQQPFTDLQQVQLRAQIFVYGALIQGTVPDEAYMISAFGDGGRTIWENAWRAGIERVHGQKSLLVSPETPLQSHIGAKTSDQPIKQKTPQSKIISSPASWSTSKGTPTTSIVNPMIPLSSPLWSICSPSGDALQSTGLPRGAVMDYQLAISPLHPPPARNFIGHNPSWMSQSSFRGPWTPQTPAFDGNACYPVRPLMEAVNLNPVKASVPQTSSVKQVSAVPMVQSGNPANVFAGTPLIDTKKTALTPGQHSADPKPRKRKKSTVPEEPGQIISHFQPESSLATVVGDQKSDQRVSLSEETLSKHENAQKHAEDAAALAAAAVSQSQEIWSQLDKHRNSGLAPDVETQLTSAAVAVAAAAAVAKAAAAAANVASKAALQAKLMADEALISSGFRNSIPSNSISDSMKKLSKATPVSILRGEDATTSSNSAIVVAREAARRRLEAASAASKQAENMDAIVKAAELAAEAVSQAGKIVAMGEPFSLTELLEAGPEAYWKVPQASPEPNGAIREHINIVSSVEAPGSSVGHLKEVPVDKREKQSDNHGKLLALREMAGESMEDHSRLTDLAPVATGEKDKKGQKGRKASDVAKTKGVASESQIGFGSPLMTIQSAHEKAGDGETSKDNDIREGSHVEVLRDGGGSTAAWYLADILDLKDGKAYVCYTELRQEDGDKLKEWVELELEGYRAPRIRNSRPITAMSFEGTRKRRRAAMGDYNWSVGDRVDAWMQNSWWEGVVTEKSKKDETSFTVHFPAQGETSVVKAWLLRPSLMWKKGSWVEWSSSLDNNESSHEGDTPQEKRQRLSNPAVEAKGKDKLSKNVDIKESGQPDDTRLLDLSASEEAFNIGKSTKDESKTDSLRMIRTGLKKKGSGVVFGVPKPGKKQKFMEVSKHYVAGQSSKTCETSDPAKFTKYLMPRGSEPRGTKNKIEPKEKRMAISKPKILNPGKLPSVSSRSIPQKDQLPNTMVSEPGSVVASDVSKSEDSKSHAENISGKPNMMEFRSFSSSDGAAEGPVLFSSMAFSLDAPPKKASASNAKSERINKGKLAPPARKLAKTEEKIFNGKSTKVSADVVEPRRSNRRIQPTSRLLEGIQSSLTISKIPSVLHDKSQSRSTRGNNQG
ncbi:hypothetical protein V6N12_004749 [Hibiscus sabdariffa]|uniref:Agenet domain-containing protein n=1 Tax=Hibiscus sabdariffa TaxID=183260 RepID=A0ABR2CP49_9ROSI